MAVAIRSNGLHHAVSLGTIEMSSSSSASNPHGGSGGHHSGAHLERNYDSEDEQMARGRARLRHTSSTELYPPRASVYSKGDIREQYCLTDRQLNSIERPRRADRFFGCLSRRGAPPSFLGVCVGRRVPSDENLAAYAPFYKPPRYPGAPCRAHAERMQDDADAGFGEQDERGGAYFRRQPASILSTSKQALHETIAIAPGASIAPRACMTSTGTQAGWLGGHQHIEHMAAGVPKSPATACCWWLAAPSSGGHCRAPTASELLVARVPATVICAYHCPQSAIGAVTTPRTKHVSFARSHTLTSFDDAQLGGLRSSGRLKAARSQERLIGGKKLPLITGAGAGLLYEAALPGGHAQQPQAVMTLPLHQHALAMHPSGHVHLPAAYQHGHAHLHAAPLHHVHGAYGVAPDVASDEPLALGVVMCASSMAAMAPLSPEVVVLEKKFRSAMKTQATQTELQRREALAGGGGEGRAAQPVALSPRTVHRVRVVSQGAQTNGLGDKGENGKKLAKSLSEMPNGFAGTGTGNCQGREPPPTAGGGAFADHEMLHRTQSEEPPRSPLAVDAHNNINYYYKPPPPPPDYATSLYQYPAAGRRHAHGHVAEAVVRRKSFHYADMDAAVVAPPFDYASNSLPRGVTCSGHQHRPAADFDEFASRSLPRASLADPIDFAHAHLLPPPQQYRIPTDGRDVEDDLDSPMEELGAESPPPRSCSEAVRRQSMAATFAAVPDEASPFRRDDLRRQSMPVFVKKEKLIDGYAPRSSFRTPASGRRGHVHDRAGEEQEIFIDFKPFVPATAAPAGAFIRRAQPLPSLHPVAPPHPAVQMALPDRRRRQDEDDKSLSAAADADGGGSVASGCSASQLDDDDDGEAEDVEEEEEELDDEADEADDAEEEQEEYEEDDDEIERGPAVENDNDEEANQQNDPLYENVVPVASRKASAASIHSTVATWQRSISLDEPAGSGNAAGAGSALSGEDCRTHLMGVSAPPSPGRDELLVNVSTYPSSDSLANDGARDHSDGIWNESQVTVLTATAAPSSIATPDTLDADTLGPHLLTPGARRKHLLLQHQQQRSSIDTDALELEEMALGGLDAVSPTTTIGRQMATPTKQHLGIAPTIAVTPSPPVATTAHARNREPQASPLSGRRTGKGMAASSPARRAAHDSQPMELNRNYATDVATTHRPAAFSAADLSECSTATNTDEYATCTETVTGTGTLSRRTPAGMNRTTTTATTSPPPLAAAATSSSSTATYVPVSTQSSQMDKTAGGGSSFESASSLYSTRVESLPEETLVVGASTTGSPAYVKHIRAPAMPTHAARKSPSHSLSSNTSSGSFHAVASGYHAAAADSAAGRPAEGSASPRPGHSPPTNVAQLAQGRPLLEHSVMEGQRMKSRLPQRPPPSAQPIKDENTVRGREADGDGGDDDDDEEEEEDDDDEEEEEEEEERSDRRYSSSGYYESPHEDDQHLGAKQRRAQHHTHQRPHPHQKTSAVAAAAAEAEDRRRRKSTMKLDIEKENIRALTSPIRRRPAPPATSAPIVIGKEHQPSAPHSTTGVQTSDAAAVAAAATDPLAAANTLSKIKRLRPKIRRQLRKTSRDEHALQLAPPQRYQKAQAPLEPPHAVVNEKLLAGSSRSAPLAAAAKHKPTSAEGPPKVPVAASQQSAVSVSPAPGAPTAATHGASLKAKSVESLRSVSPGSDSVFYSEADGPEGDHHCLQCDGAGAGRGHAVGHKVHSAGGLLLGADSVESLAYIEHDEDGADVRAHGAGGDSQQDIVRPPSDFADSPVALGAAKTTTQRLYKKMDKRRFRSEERYHHKTRQENIRAKSEERTSRDSTLRHSPRSLRAAGSSPCVLPTAGSGEDAAARQHVVYRGHFDPGRYTRLTDADVWTQLKHQNFDRRDRDRRASTDSEHSFRAKYQVILHRLVQRRCTLEMYHRQNNNAFRVDKTIVVNSDSGEFGFRIHGSKPVVVAAIEPDTPAESSGLEVGDILIAVNGVPVLDKHHTEVVKIAHDGCERLELQVARTIGVLLHEAGEPSGAPLLAGYLWRQSGQAKGAPNARKWVRRWFCLRPDHCLYYYKTETETQPVGAMIMAKHTVQPCGVDVGRPHAFQVDSGEGVPLFAAADSEELAQRWVAALQLAATQAGDAWLDKCSRNLYQPPSSIGKPDCFGYLLKLGSRWCGWSKRYCVLKDACLYFYQDANSKSAFGMACLHGYKVASMSTNAAGKKNAFEIVPPEMKLRHYYFATESEMDKKRWISALEYSVDRWIKSG